MLQLRHPHVARIDCQDCLIHMYDLKTGKRQTSNGKPIPRGRTKPPCSHGPDMCPKVKPGHSDLTPQNRRVWQHYLMCKAINEWPDDGTVILHKIVMDQLTETYEQQKNADYLALQIAKLITPRKKGQR